jgi:hypothetical protein
MVDAIRERLDVFDATVERVRLDILLFSKCFGWRHMLRQ